MDLIDISSADVRTALDLSPVLDGECGVFPQDDAPLPMRLGVVARSLWPLQGRMSAAAMIAMNGQVKLDGSRLAKSRATSWTAAR